MGKDLILTLGAFPRIKEWEPNDNNRKNGYLVLKEDLPKSVYDAETKLHKEMAANDLMLPTKAFQDFLVAMHPYVMGISLKTGKGHAFDSDWKRYLPEFGIE